MSVSKNSYFAVFTNIFDLYQLSNERAVRINGNLGKQAEPRSFQIVEIKRFTNEFEDHEQHKLE